MIHFLPISHIILQNADVERVNQMLNLTQGESKSIESVLSLRCLDLTKYHIAFWRFSKISLQVLLNIKIFLPIYKREKYPRSNNNSSSME